MSVQAPPVQIWREMLMWCLVQCCTAIIHLNRLATNASSFASACTTFIDLEGNIDVVFSQCCTTFIPLFAMVTAVLLYWVCCPCHLTSAQTRDRVHIWMPNTTIVASLTVTPGCVVYIYWSPHKKYQECTQITSPVILNYLHHVYYQFHVNKMERKGKVHI